MASPNTVDSDFKRLDEQPAKRQRSRNVCTECRQQKHKCDLALKAPESCTRCSLHGLDCRVDAEFKRTRRRIAPPVVSPHMSSNLDILGAAAPIVHPPSIAPLVVSPPTPSNLDILAGPTASIVHLPPPIPQLSVLAPAGAASQHPVPWLTSFEVADGTVNLSPVQTTVLFSAFFDRYHAACPLFVFRRDPAVLYLHEPLLFWTIIAIALRRPATGVSPMSFLLPLSLSYDALANHVTKMAGEVATKPSRSVATVQALLLICQWPFPALRIKEDLGWHFSALATQTALQLGLHRPQHSRDFSSREHVDPESPEGQERTRAWLWCHILSVDIAAALGLPCLLPDDFVATQAATFLHNPPPWLSEIPIFIKQTLRVSRLTQRISAFLGQSVTTSTGQADPTSTAALLPVLSASLSDLESSLRDDSSSIVLARLLLGRLQLLSFALQLPDDSHSAEATNIARAECLFSSVKLLRLMDAVGSDEARYWPQSLTMGASISAIVLLRLLPTHAWESAETTELLTLVSHAYRMVLAMVLRNECRFARLLAFAAREAQLRHSTGEISRTEGNMPEVRSRIGMPNWLFQTIGLAKAMRGSHEALYPDELVSNEAAAPIDATADEANLFLDEQFNYSLEDFNSILANFTSNSDDHNLGGDGALLGMDDGLSFT